MYISKKDREIIKNKYNGLCAYSGTPLENDWQVEHIVPVVREIGKSNKCLFSENHSIENMVPVQRLINHYKHSLGLETFRTWYMANLHIQLKNLPKKPVTAKSIRRKEYMFKVAAYFGITEEIPFSGKFYFETQQIQE